MKWKLKVTEKKCGCLNPENDRERTIMLGGKLSKEGPLVEFHRDPLFSPLVTGGHLLQLAPSAESPSLGFKSGEASSMVFEAGILMFWSFQCAV
jgi:hypothetical protein